MLDAGVDRKNAYLWLKVATEVGIMGVANIYTGHSPAKRAKIWNRMIAEIDCALPWILGGDWNFVERRADKQGGLRFSHKEEDVWLEMRDMELFVGDPWVLKPQCIPRASTHYTWQNKCKAQPIWQQLDRFYLPVQWMPRVKRVEVQAGAYKSDHFPVAMELALRVEDLQEHQRSAMRFFRVNMDVARSKTVSTGVRDILARWKEKEEQGGALKKLEGALTDCRSFLRQLGKDWATQRRAREKALRGSLQQLLVRIPTMEGQQLSELQGQINEVARQLENLEEGAAKGHRIRARMKWEMEGDRPTAFFYQKVQAKRAKKLMESLPDKSGTIRQSQEELQTVVEEAYTNIFDSKGPDAEWQAVWAEHQHLFKVKVSEQQRAVMDRSFTVEELGEALKELPAGKSPGHDGATQEFYSFFWEELREMVLEAIQEAWEKGSIGEYFNKGLVCLCPK